MLNKVTLIGFLGADPEVRSLSDGARVTNLRLATSESWKDRSSGERRERTEWHRVTLWGDGIANYLGYACKGTLVMVEGKLETRKWTDNEGHDRYSTEIVVNQKGGGQVKILRDGVDAQPEEPEPQPRTRGRRKAQPSGNASADTDEIPF
ncbi:single-stranded DNA-binding protein [uncultured Phenylobacterium sp.]|uniref:single-stranded DNA-binding protein n=1 Tax=uncultured Phenylobacterium sp. TaxID=349273 RepID=UPI0025ED3000|nr:single-stranded DNA-binding protein [uncultured Phenylobacterium sp.]